MMKLMIVDDDFQIREGMRRAVKWDQLGIDEVLTGSNGLEALEIFREKRPEIVLADIQMPGMNGLEMTREIRKISTTARIIFISAYTDFSYCQEALKLGANDYVVKPIQIRNLMDIVRTNVEQYKIDNENSDYMNQLQIKEEMRKIYRSGSRNSGEELCRLISQSLDQELGKENYFITAKAVSLSGDQSTDWIRSIRDYLNQFGRYLCLPVDEELEGREGIILTQGSNSGLLSVYTQNEMKKHLNKWNELYGDKYGKIIAGISGSHNREHFRDGYLQAEKVMEQSFYDGPGAYLKIPEQSDLLDAEIIPENIKNTVSGYLKEKNWEKLEAYMSTCESVFRKHRTSPQTVRNWVMGIWWKIYITRNPDRGGGDGNDVRTGEQRTNEIIDLLPEEDKQEYRKLCRTLFLEPFFREISGILHREAQKMSLVELPSARENFSPAVRRGLEFVDLCYGRQIVLADAAEYAGKSSSYFSSIFKKETGRTFSDYLTAYRLAKAHWLLEHTDKKVKDVCEEVGYTNYVYFSQQFKQQFGYPATAVRK